jgi:hypothetical protein
MDTEEVKQIKLVKKSLAVILPAILLGILIYQLYQSKPISGIVILSQISMISIFIILYYVILLPIILIFL